MVKPKLAQYARGALLRLRQAASDEWHAMPLYRAVVFSGPAPILHKPWPKRPFTPDPVHGEDIADGVLQLAGKRLSFDSIEDAWAQPTPSRAFASSLHSFGWLDDVCAYENHDEAAALTRGHVDAWINKYGRWNRFAWNEAITAERCLAWLGAAAYLFSGNAVDISTRLDSLGRQLRHLKSVIPVCDENETKLWIAIALATAGTCLFGMKGFQKTGLDLLELEIGKQVLPDGGHGSRNPQIAARLMVELDALSTLLDQQTMMVPSFIRQTLDKLQPFVRFCMMATGELAPFNGGGVGDRLAIRQALPVLRKSETPFLFAPHSKYQRLQSKRSTLLFDCGGTPLGAQASNAHAGTLSFVFETKSGNLITNCGWSADLSEQWRYPSRTSAAHSTLIIDDMSSSRVLVKGLATKLLGPIAYDREDAFPARRTENDDGVWLSGRHREYVSRYGLQHNRRLFLDKTGFDLRGEDSLERPVGVKKTQNLQPIAYVLRFHLHPNVRASMARDHCSALLLLENGEGWRFRCDQAQISLEPSIYLATGAPPKRTVQILITGAADPNGMGEEPSNCVRWSLRKIDTNS